MTDKDSSQLLVAPLEGVRVLDFTRQMAGPYATVFLADYGADVIKVEGIPGGDASRDAGIRMDEKVSATFLMWNRGKRSVALDLHDQTGVDVVKRLAATCDIVIENYKPGVAEKIGIGYESLSADHPELIYVSLSAFGRGALAEEPGTDPVIQAMSGIMSVTGEQDGDPILVGVPIADFTGAMTVTQAVMLGLIARQRSGIGQHIEVSMLTALMSALTTRLATYWATGVDPKPNGGAHSTVAPYEVFRTADGYAVAGVWNGANVMWPRFCEAVGQPELAQDERFKSNEDRLANRGELSDILNREFVARTTAEWENRFRELHVLFGPVQSFSQALSHPDVVDSGVVSHVEHPVLGEIPQLGPVIQLHRSPGRLRLPPPLLGQHTRGVLEEVGYSTGEVDWLVDTGIALCSSHEELS
jgi:crotonobetainyl-CoA:carnitine CoA-transferase CaiB-like acyl-CoA transferase